MASSLPSIAAAAAHTHEKSDANDDNILIKLCVDNDPVFHHVLP
jgi:hypothetical protein